MRRPRPILGPALSVFGVMLWSFLVFGQYTTTWFPGSAPLGEGAAAFSVFVATALAWVFAIRRSLVVPAGSRRALVGRGVRVGASAAGLWLGTVLLALAVGQSSRADLDLPVTSLLLLVSGAAFVAGRRLTFPERAPRTRRERAIAIVLWAGAATMTLAACAELAGNE